MGVPRELLYTILKYRKRKKKPLGPTIPGYAGQCDHAKPVSRLLGDQHPLPAKSVPRQEEYMGSFPEDYFPRAGFMEMPDSDYTPYDGHIAESMSNISGQFPISAGHMVNLGAQRIDDSVNNDDSVDADLPSLVDLTVALNQLQNVLPDGHPDILRLSTAIQIMCYNMSGKMEEDSDTGHIPSEETCHDSFESDPYQEAEQVFDQQIQLLESQFNDVQMSQLDPDSQMDEVYHVQEALFNAIQPQDLAEDMAMDNLFGLAGPSDAPGPESLEQIMEDYEMQQMDAAPNDMAENPFADGNAMAPEFFPFDMYERTEASAPYPDPYMQYGEMDQQNMHDDPMPEPEPDPEEMMGPGMNPYMMPGPMGPDHMPDPPPGP